MKGLLSFLMALLLTILSFGTSLEYNFTVEEPLMTESGKIIANTEYYTAITGQPVIPFLSKKVILPFGYAISNVSVMMDGLTSAFKVNNIGIKDLPFLESCEELSGQLMIDYPNEYPMQKYEIASVQRVCGADIAFINLYPYRYFDQQKKLAYYKNVHIEIKLIYSSELEYEQGKMISRNSFNLKNIADGAINFSAIYSYPQENILSGNRTIFDPDEPHNMLIITGQDYLDVFTEYAQWKEQMGISVFVATVEDIYSEYMIAVDDAERIRNFIRDVYTAWASADQPLEYVLLGGDDEIIPVRGAWATNSYYGDDANIPCDFYYAALDGTWDANCNQIYAELEDEPDLGPEISIGRFPGDTHEDFENIIFKIKEYVENPWPNINTALMIGEQLSDAPTWGGDLLDGICDNPDFLPSDYVVTKLYDRDGTFSTSAVVNHIDLNGSAFILHCAHTYFNYLFGLNQNGVRNLTNTRYPFFSSGGCHTLAFEQSSSGNAEAVGEIMMIDENGAMGYWGHSRYGFTTWAEYIKSFLIAIFQEDIPQIGHAITYSRQQALPFINDQFYRWEYIELNYMGDPHIGLIENPVSVNSSTALKEKSRQVLDIYPNPFNPNTTITFDAGVQESDVSISIYNVKGQKIKDFENVKITSGKNTVNWDGKDNQGNMVGSGIYFTILDLSGDRFCKKMLLIK